MVHQASPTVDKWTKTLANLEVEMALLGTPTWAHHLAHSFQHCWYAFAVDIPVTPITS